MSNYVVEIERVFDETMHTNTGTKYAAMIAAPVNLAAEAKVQCCTTFCGVTSVYLSFSLTCPSPQAVLQSEVVHLMFVAKERKFTVGTIFFANQIPDAI